MASGNDDAGVFGAFVVEMKAAAVVDLMRAIFGVYQQIATAKASRRRDGALPPAGFMLSSHAVWYAEGGK